MKRAAQPEKEPDSKNKRTARSQETIGIGTRETTDNDDLKVSQEVASAVRQESQIMDSPSAAMALEYDYKKEFMTFPEKLMDLLEEDSEVKECLWWLPDGKAFCFLTNEKFRAGVLDKHFDGLRFESFTRKLNRWGFKRYTKQTLPTNTVAYHHSKFWKSRNDLLIQVRCNTGGQVSELPSVEEHKDSQCSAANLEEEETKPRSSHRRRSHPSFVNQNSESDTLTTQNAPPPYQVPQSQMGVSLPEPSNDSNSALAQSLVATLFSQLRSNSNATVVNAGQKPQTQETNTGQEELPRPSASMQSEIESMTDATVLQMLLQQQRSSTYQVLQNNNHHSNSLPASNNPVESNVSQSSSGSSFISNRSSIRLGSDTQASNNTLPQSVMTSRYQQKQSNNIGGSSMVSHLDLQALSSNLLAFLLFKQQQQPQQQQQMQQQQQPQQQQQMQQQNERQQQRLEPPAQVNVQAINQLQNPSLQQQPLDLGFAAQLLSFISSSSADRAASTRNIDFQQPQSQQQQQQQQPDTQVQPQIDFTALAQLQNSALQHPFDIGSAVQVLNRLSSSSSSDRTASSDSNELQQRQRQQQQRPQQQNQQQSQQQYQQQHQQQSESHRQLQRSLPAVAQTNNSSLVQQPLDIGSAIQALNQFSSSSLPSNQAAASSGSSIGLQQILDLLQRFQNNG